MIKKVIYLLLAIISVCVFFLPNDWILQNVQGYEREFELSSKLIYAKFYLAILLSILALGIHYSLFRILLRVFKMPVSKPILIPLSFLFCLLVYLANWFPVMLDEANSFLFFVKRGFLVTAAYYPSPNNHIFNNLLGGIINLFGFHSAMSLRLLSICSVIATGYFLHIFLKEFFSSTVAIFTTLMWLSFYQTLAYGFLGRGYSLEVLLFVLSLLSLVYWCKTKDRAYLYWYIVFSILGFYTVPTFLFYFLPASLFWFWEFKDLKNWFISQLSIGAGVLLLYFPIILFSGWDKLLSNHWVSSSESFYTTFMSQLEGFFEFQWFYSNGLYFSLILIALFYIIGKNKGPLLKTLGLSYGVLILVSGLMQHFPPFRSLNLFTLLNFIIIALLLESVLEKSRVLLYTTPILIAFWSVFTISNFKDQGMLQYHDLERVEELIQSHKIERLTVGNDFYFVMLKYHLGEKLDVYYSKDCEGYFLSVEKQKNTIGETEFTSLLYCEE